MNALAAFLVALSLWVMPPSPFDRVHGCEAATWDATGGTYDGGLQMTQDFWIEYDGLDYASRPHLASRTQQIVVAMRARDGYTNHAGRKIAPRGYSPWPNCGRLAYG